LGRAAISVESSQYFADFRADARRDSVWPV
jgi:hypothetical protein